MHNHLRIIELFYAFTNTQKSLLIIVCIITTGIYKFYDHDKVIYSCYFLSPLSICHNY